VLLPEARNLEPLPFVGMSDYHCHCDYSSDASGSIGEFCEAALERNLAEICFTTHYDSNPDVPGANDGANLIRVNGEMKPTNPDLLAPYVDEVRVEHERFYQRGLSVKLGLEFGWFPGCEEVVEQLKARYGFDYFLCGIHELENLTFGSSDQYERCFARYSVEEMAEKYFREVATAARTGMFDAIAHLDYYKKYGERFYGPAIHSVHEPYLSEAFRALRESGVGLEVNTAAMRHGFGDYYPKIEIINAARQAGVEVNLLGSDAHSPEQVGYDFEAASALVPPFLASCDD
jgi:histidinol-phosphatase (PHP family)